MSGISKLLVLTAVMTVFIGGLAYLSQHFTLGSIKANTVGNGQHGTARWITPKEKRITCTSVTSTVRSPC